MERQPAKATSYYLKLFRYRGELTSDLVVAQEWVKRAQEDPQEPVIAYIAKQDKHANATALQLKVANLERDIFRCVITLTGSQIYPEISEDIITLDVSPSQIIEANIFSFYVDGVYYDYARNNSSGCLHDHVVDEEFLSEKIARKSVVYGVGGYIQTTQVICMIGPNAFQTITGEIYKITH